MLQSQSRSVNYVEKLFLHRKKRTHRPPGGRGPSCAGQNVAEPGAGRFPPCSIALSDLYLPRTALRTLQAADAPGLGSTPTSGRALWPSVHLPPDPPRGKANFNLDTAEVWVLMSAFGDAVAAADLRWQACPTHSWADWLLLLLSGQAGPTPLMLFLWAQLLPLPSGNKMNRAALRFELHNWL